MVKYCIFDLDGTILDTITTITYYVNKTLDVEGLAHITEADAKAIALAHAGLSEGEVKKLKCETDKDDGVLVYEVEFKVGNVEYEYEIAAKDGSVIKYDVEKDD